eukprot:TRINITY_DN8725_c0_g3_i1.p1 TRINITY_DN8725_c0_g3~~TRINITY_DN8725_c0_g3_i1.p1  ORF type:complete len:594 (+),score=100.68 TRINITY_DN8725_c0_g3_i1:165-1946(+)
MMFDLATPPRKIAKELTMMQEEVASMQQSFIEAHERQVQHLLRLLEAHGVHNVQIGSLEETQSGGLPPEPLAADALAGPEDRIYSLRRASEPCIKPTMAVRRRSEQESLEIPNAVTQPEESESLRRSAAQAGEDVPAPARPGVKGSSTAQILQDMGMLEACKADVDDAADAAFLTELPSKDVPDGRSVAPLRGALASKATALAGRIHAFTDNDLFDLAIVGVVILNAIYVGYETEWQLREDVGTPMPSWMIIVSRTFTVLLVCELLMRMCGGLRRFFCSGDPWNYFDFIVVVTGLLEEILHQLARVSVSSTRLVRLVRITRAAKIFRMVRIVRLIGALRMLISSLLGTLRQCLWSFVLMVCLMYVFAVIFGQLVCQAKVREWKMTDETLTEEYWGTLLNCMYTLYGSISGGVSWSDAAVPLEDFGWASWLAFLLYVAFVKWVVLNVITACFCESAAEAARKDVGLAVEAYRTDRDNFLSRCRAIFSSVDKDGSGRLEMRDLKAFLASDQAPTLFATMDIDIGDVCGWFEMLAEDGVLIDLQEFMFGCLRLRGGAKALDLAKIQNQNTKISNKLADLLEYVGPTGNLRQFAGKE